jgi:hypothetical protein
MTESVEEIVALWEGRARISRVATIDIVSDILPLIASWRERGEAIKAMTLQVSYDRRMRDYLNSLPSSDAALKDKP